jgi:hypothetical protein
LTIPSAIELLLAGAEGVTFLALVSRIQIELRDATVGV